MASDTGDAGRIAIPKTIAEVDAAWLTQALALRDPGVVVESAEVVESMGGGACTKLRVKVQTNRPDYPATIIVKGCLEPRTLALAGMQLREVNIYNRIVPRLQDVQAIRVLFADGDEDRGAALVMEDLDLRGARCLKALEPIDDFDLAARFIDALAKLHSQWWQSPSLADEGEFGWLPRFSQALLGDTFHRLSDPAIRADLLGRPRGAATPGELHDPDRLTRGFLAMIDACRDEPMVLAHGDPHPSNLFVDAHGRPGLLDWTCMRLPWVNDVTNFIAGALDAANRRRWERRLLEHYLGRLAAYGVAPPSFERAWLAYRRWPMFSLIVWLVNIPEYHTESMITAMTVRYAMMAIDHDTLGLLI